MNVDVETLEALVQHGRLSADSVAIGFVGTEADKAQAIIKRALECLIGNGLVEVKNREDWPVLVILDPPFNMGDVFGRSVRGVWDD